MDLLIAIEPTLLGDAVYHVGRHNSNLHVRPLGIGNARPASPESHPIDRANHIYELIDL